jgi:hypothetical protein
MGINPSLESVASEQPVVAKVEDWGQCTCHEALGWSQMVQNRACKLHDCGW